MKEKIQIFLPAAMSTFGIPYILKGQNTDYPISNSVLAIFIFIGCYVLMRYVYKNVDLRAKKIGVLCGLIFSICMVLGANVINTDSTEILMMKTWAKIILILPIFAAFVALILHKITESQNTEKESTGVFSTRKLFFLVWIIIFALWIPVFLAAYPGIYGYDSIFQTQDYFNHSVNTHHPIAHTYLLGFFVVTLGKNCIGNVNAGMALYSIFQMLCMSAIFSALYVFFIKSRVKSLKLRVLILGLFSLLPINALMAISSTKDILFAGLFAVMIMQLFLMIEKNERLNNWKFCVGMIVVAEICIWFRNQEIYIFLIGMLACMIIIKKYRKQLVVILLSVVALYGIYSGPVTNLVAQKTGDSINEMMSIPCVQLSRAMVRNTDELTQDEKELIEEYIPDYDYYDSVEAISDNMKNTFRSDLFKENPGEFIHLWLKVGKEHPVTYIDAFARITIGWWYPDMNYRDDKAYHPYWEYDATGMDGRFQDYILVEQKSVPGFKKLGAALRTLSYENTYQKIPVVSMLFSSGSMVWGIFIYIAFMIYQKRYKYLLVAVFILAFWLTLLVGPVVLYRYIYPIAVIEPLLFAAMLTKSDKKIESKKCK